jgi:hypothetical protein
VISRWGEKNKNFWTIAEHCCWWVQNFLSGSTVFFATQAVGIVITIASFVIGAALLLLKSDLPPLSTPGLEVFLLGFKPTVDSAGKAVEAIKKRVRPITQRDLLEIHSVGASALHTLIRDNGQRLTERREIVFQSAITYVGTAVMKLTGGKGDARVYLFAKKDGQIEQEAAFPDNLKLAPHQLASLQHSNSAVSRVFDTKKSILCTNLAFDIATSLLVAVDGPNDNKGSLFLFPISDETGENVKFVLSVHTSENRSLRTEDRKLLTRIAADISPVIRLIDIYPELVRAWQNQTKGA